jgi:hypothetical protein
VDTHGLSPRQYELARSLAERITSSRWRLDHDDRRAAETPYHCRSKMDRNLDRAMIKGHVTGLTFLLGRPDDTEAAEAFIQEEAPPNRSAC